ncbi:MAG: imidazole glycerol phosphate synthase subunit HisH [Oscillospiraceae bacterium]|nr:imidazole glycerol phosphate synthase subunit HisH [Oscillospiraceae bacterium]
MIAVVDYGAGNLHSVKNALDFLGADSAVTSDSEAILSADGVILPGVGAFGDAMKEMKKRGLDRSVKTAADNAAKGGKPFLGICMGLQLLFDESEESPGAEGLGTIPGKVVKIKKYPGLKIPHMGWNNITMPGKSRILKGFEKEPFVYFVHSYYILPEDESVVSAYTEYGERLPVAVESGNLFAMQFHPEKSGEIGMGILKNFLNLRKG